MSDRPQGRPSKFIPIAKAMHALFDKPDKRITVDEGGDDDIALNFKVIAMTDEGLLDILNDLVDESERISERTFQSYKAGEIVVDEPDYEYVRMFVASYKKALHHQAYMLSRALAEGIPGEWQKYAWLLERKFDEFNLRQKQVDETPDVKRLVFRVMG
jgi:hypothetical protein